MFLVTTESPLDDEWEQRDREIRKHAGCPSTTHAIHGASKIVKHEWRVDDFNAAVRMKWRLELIPQVKVSLREYASGIDGQ